ncbi:hypothetical protein H696_02979 [Fonticula alba]|uniref:MC family mitochondrial carrier protein n=1 Tax=Fonticula alba TaxID=691883 RepID=A0A058ZB18_FONAL|nr:hypothetical protein H696_02979 [Fonticula alba]KCV70622.1 hypothetical protein H696_02979 [Fonticula alba]|eukprot:XP_009495138.1 hypothetical protein H696_02979 [Fonticula alba]
MSSVSAPSSVPTPTSVGLSATPEFMAMVAPANFVKNLACGGTAGMVGALATFPIDTAKTRMQADGGRMYRNIPDALVKIARQTGLRSLYRGLPVQLIGIIPEKALKLSVNDSARYFLRNRENNTIHWSREMIAGATAGFCQVVITSPMEMFKIRLQMSAAAAESGAAPRTSAVNIIRDTIRQGGVFRGAGATLLRDVTFSLLYFPMFANLKGWIAGRDANHPVWSTMLRDPGPAPAGHTGPRDINSRVNFFGTFMAGLISGSAAGWLVTPADVIKTRLQAAGGVEKWKNIRTCAKMTLAQEGPTAFFKGATARVFLVGPLFGVVLMTYEVLPRLLGL